MSKNVKLFIKKYSLPWQCQHCRLTEWNGEQIPLEQHHIDGNHYNNDYKNIMILCPNCHAQTENYRGKNRKDKLKETYHCSKCNKELYEQNSTMLCKECYLQLEKNRSKCPGKDILEQDYKTLKSFNKIGKKYKVSDKTAKKWLQNFNLIPM